MFDAVLDGFFDVYMRFANSFAGEVSRILSVSLVAAYVFLRFREWYNFHHMFAFLQKTVVPVLDIRLAHPPDYPRADPAFYGKCQKTMESQGYSYLADIEIANFRGTYMDPRAFIRLMVSGDGTVCCSFMKRRLPLFHRIMQTGIVSNEYYDFTVEGVDGRFFSVAKGFDNSQLETAPETITRLAPTRYCLDEVRRLFEHEYAAFRAENSGFVPCRRTTIDETIASNQRHAAFTCAFHVGRGYITREDVTKFIDDPALAEKAYMKFRRGFERRGMVAGGSAIGTERSG